ncbi:hypothetical protein DL96DRAFT_1705981 [Flagelloscypha sp. PMI_526]|nr:hypothetical protein DL96DRAFT_1705981 [Flagelloscypha sp. PMI_526]
MAGPNEGHVLMLTEGHFFLTTTLIPPSSLLFFSRIAGMRKRQTNKSHKVPNVKLRPAQTTTKTVHSEHHTFVNETQPTEPEPHRFITPRPFKDVVVCATGINDKREIFKLALELGANYVNAFTDRVTHLIAEKHGGAKYHCAVERKIPILTPRWIFDSYDLWLKGDDVDFEQSVITYRLPVFSGAVICISGLEDVEKRLEIHKLTTRNGGEYKKNLERPVTVTHLLCAGDIETDKIKYASKFKRTGESEIHLVWEEWFWDSLEFGGRFREDRYDIYNPRPERSVMIEPTPTPSGSYPQAPNPVNHHSRRPGPVGNASDAEEELASIVHSSDLTVLMHESLMRNRGWEAVGGKLQRSPSKPKPKRVKSPSPMDEDLAPSKKGVIASFRRSNSFAPAHAASPSMHPFKRTSTAGTREPLFIQGASSIKHRQPVQPQSSMLSISVPADETIAGPSTSIPKIFVGKKFWALGEAKSVTVRKAIEDRAGALVSPQDYSEDEIDFILVRLASGSQFYIDEGDELVRDKYRTECWLEQCVLEELKGAEFINISLSGLCESEIVWCKRLIRSLGANEYSLLAFRGRQRTCSVLHEMEPNSTKRTNEWNIPVVGFEWFVQIVETGRILHLEPESTGDSTSTKGKGRERAVDVDQRMQDITNASDSQGSTTSSQGHGSSKKSKTPMHSAEPLPMSQPDPQPFLTPSFNFGQPDPNLSVPHPPHTSTPFSQHRRPVISRSESMSSIRTQEDEDRVPSSNSPSPMKLGSTGGRNGFRRSPSKQMLEEELGSLLGRKRPPFEPEEREPRAGKRPRPRPVRQKSRQEPHDNPEHDEPPAMGLGPLVPVVHEGDYYDQLNQTQNGDEDSMRIVYEDAAQRDAKEALFGSGGEGSKPKGKGGTKGKTTVTRRATRSNLDL